MERFIDDQECRRRADEIISRRNGIKIDDECKTIRSIYKILFEIIILANFFVMCILYYYRVYIFSDIFRNDVKNIYNNFENKIVNSLEDMN